MRVAFYKGRKRIFNRLVAWWTRGPYSHCELVLDDGSAVSSSFMDGGVRYKHIDFAPDLWDFVEIGPEYPAIRERIYVKYGRGYDWRGLIGFVFRRVADHREKEFCSEFVMSVIGYDEAWRFDPNTAKSALEHKHGR